MSIQRKQANTENNAHVHVRNQTNVLYQFGQGTVYLKHTRQTKQRQTV